MTICGASQVEGQISADERVLVGFVIGEDLERQGMQAVAGQDRRGFIKRLMHGRLPAAHVVIVHARQIVVDQRVDVDRLDSGTDADGAVLINGEQAGRGDRQQRPEALSATDGGMAHGLEQAVAAVARRA